jgi:hypothetical protein
MMQIEPILEMVWFHYEKVECWMKPPKKTLNIAVAVLLSQTAPSIITYRYHTALTCCFCAVNISYIKKYVEWKLWQLQSTNREYMHRMEKSTRRRRRRRKCTRRSVYLALFLKKIKNIYRLPLSILVEQCTGTVLKFRAV